MLSYQLILNINQNWFFKSKCSLWSVSFSPKLIQSNFFRLGKVEVFAHLVVLLADEFPYIFEKKEQVFEKQIIL